MMAGRRSWAAKIWHPTASITVRPNPMKMSLVLTRRTLTTRVVRKTGTPTIRTHQRRLRSSNGLPPVTRLGGDRFPGNASG